MKHAVILAHPKPTSFCASLAQEYVAAAHELGHRTVVRDLYRMPFDPCLKAEEIPTSEGFIAAPDVLAERKLLQDADVFALVYPFWFNAPPAILKGYIDRVFSMGFGYEPTFGGTTPLLYDRKLISFTTSGAPDEWVRRSGAMSALHTLFDRHVSEVTGLTLVDHVHFGGITPVLTPEAAYEMLKQVRAAVRHAFLSELAT